MDANRGYQSCIILDANIRLDYITRQHALQGAWFGLTPTENSQTPIHQYNIQYTWGMPFKAD